MAKPCRVLIVDDHQVARLGVGVLLERLGGYEVCGEAATVAAARELAERERPEVIVLDLLLGGRDGMELIGELRERQAGAKILVYTSQDERQYARRALRAGAAGYVMKSVPIDELGQALATLQRGELAVSVAVQRALVEEALGRRVGDPTEALSDRELQVFRLMGAGRSSAEVAQELKLSIKTVGTYRERLKDKLDVGTARELERRAAAFVRETENGNGLRSSEA
jgi:DNA-binding NarL/FixJ family response regulator